LIFSMSNHVDNEQDLFDKMFLATFGFVPFWFVVSILVIYCRLSGKPFKSKQEYDNTKYISIIFMLWTAAFLVKIIIYMIFAHGDQT
jgi:heme/copper-type cytochrome/quinol oxidase subunit 2